jgi:hypothetical protein
VRHNIRCSGDKSQLTITSLKDGDGSLPNASLWIIADDDCDLNGIQTRQNLAFFTPSLRDVDKDKHGTNYSLIFYGHLLLPCESLRFRLSIESPNSSHSIDFPFVTFIDENTATGTLSSELIDTLHDEIKAEILLIIGSRKGEVDAVDVISSARFVLKNSTQTTILSENIARGNDSSADSWMTVVVVGFGIIILIIVILVIILICRLRQKSREVKGLKSRGDVELLQDVAHYKGHEMATFDIPSANRRNDCGRKQKQLKGENGDMTKSESQQNLLENVDASYGSQDGEDIAEMSITEDLKGYPMERLEQRNRGRRKVSEETIVIPSDAGTFTNTQSLEVSQEDENPTFSQSEGQSLKTNDAKGRKKPETDPTTSSLGHMVDACSCEPPFERQIVDIRDNLWLKIHCRTPEEQKGFEEAPLKVKVEEASRVCYWVLNGLKRILDSKDELAIDSLLTLSSKSIFIKHDGKLLIGICPFGQSKKEQNTEILRAARSQDPIDRDLDRWKAPEILKGKENSGTEEQVVWCVAMMFVALVSGKDPWSNLTGYEAGIQVVHHKLPPELDVLAGDSVHEIIQSCFNFYPKDRPIILSLQKEMMARIPLHGRPIDVRTITSLEAPISLQTEKSFDSDMPFIQACHNDGKREMERRITSSRGQQDSSKKTGTTKPSKITSEEAGSKKNVLEAVEREEEEEEEENEE